MVMAKTEHLHDWHHASSAEARAEIFEAVGDLDGIVVVGSQVLLGVYVRPTIKRIEGGGSLIIPESITAEDVWQGKVAMILKFGENAVPRPSDNGYDTFLRNWGGALPVIGEWVFSDVKATFALSIRGPGSRMHDDRRASGDWDPRKGWACRLAYMKDIYGRTKFPEAIV